MRRSTPRGFTLIEVIVAVTMGAVILGATVAIMAQLMRQGQLTRERADLMRQGAFIGQLIEQDLRATGLGVPSGTHADAGYGTGVESRRLFSPILVAAADQLGVLADLPRPSSQYATWGTLDNREPTGASNNSTHLSMWHTENNGSCTPNAAASCTIADTSVFFPGVAGCATGGAEADRTCAWGTRRVRDNERIQISAGDGEWATAAIDFDLHFHGHAQMKLSPGLPAAWTNDSTTARPAAVPGLGFVTTLDRVFFRRVGNTIERNQCWGDPDANDADWPLATAVAVPATPQNVPTAECTGFEEMARDVTSLTFTYFDAAGAITVPINTEVLKDSIRRIDYRILLTSTMTDGQVVNHEVVGTVNLRS